MIDPNLFAEPMPLDRVKHRTQRLKASGVRFDRTSGLNALFITAVEFADVCRDYPIVFVEAGTGTDGQREIAPMAVLGLQPGENLMLNDDGSWGARYVPAILRGYPLGIARIDDQSYAVCIDAKADALSEVDGERLFDDAGEATAFLLERRKFIEEIERETQRTRQLGRRLLELELLRPTRFDATLPDASKLVVEGFLALDEAKLAALSDATVVDLNKTGVLSLIHAQQISLGLMRALVERRVARKITV